MLKEYFLVLLTGRVLADFYIQTPEMAEKKRSNSKWLLLHCLTYFLAFFIVSIPFLSIQTLVLDIIISLCHSVVDTLKFCYQKNKREESPKVFIINQSLHLTCLVVITYIWIKNDLVLNEIYIFNKFFNIIGASKLLVCKWVLSLLIIHKPTNILIQKLIGGYKPKSNLGSGEIKIDNNIGRKNRFCRENTYASFFSRRQSEDVANKFAASERACGVKYPAPWGGLAKKKLSHAPVACCGVFDSI